MSADKTINLIAGEHVGFDDMLSLAKAIYEFEETEGFPQWRGNNVVHAISITCSRH